MSERFFYPNFKIHDFFCSKIYYRSPDSLVLFLEKHVIFSVPIVISCGIFSDFIERIQITLQSQVVNFYKKYEKNFNLKENFGYIN